MTNHNHITVTWTPDGHGDEDITVTADCAPEQTWEALTVILAAHIRAATGMTTDASTRTAIAALQHAHHYLNHTIGGH